MKQFARLNYDEFIINGEVNERLPLYNEHLYNVYPLDNCVDGIMPTHKIETGSVTIGSPSIMISKSNVSILNQAMQFTGDSNSYIEMDRELMNSEELELEFKFIITDMSSDSTIFSSEDLTIKINATNKHIYGEMPNLVGKHTPKPDLPNGAFRFTHDNSIKENTWHKLKIVKYKAIVSVIFEQDTTKSLVCESGFAPTTSYLGKGLKGQIKFINVWKHQKFLSAKTVDLPSPYSLSGIIRATANDIYDILTIGNLKVKLNNNYLTISNGSETVITTTISLNRDYGISCGFENNQLMIVMRDLKTDYILLNTTIALAYSSTAVINTNGIIRNLAIYKTRLSDNKLIAINKKKFSLNKDGDILYELDETSGHYKLKIIGGKKYHLQLTRNLNSECETIINDGKVEFVEDGVQSNLDNRKVKLLFADKINLSSTWDIIYRTKITELANGKHYDSLGNGLSWGIEDNKFVIKIVEGQTISSSFINGVNANEFLNEWIVVSVTYSSNKVTLLVCTSKGIFSTSLTKNIASITSEYDLFFGGINDTIYGQAIYRELTIINGWNVDALSKENYFRTKISYYDNKLISNVNIVELI